MDERFADGRDFLRRAGRLLERRLFATCFEGASGTGVLDALRGYRNDDGGFGHGLEPDKRCPASLPIDVECALRAMATARTVDLPLVHAACDYLATVSSGGSVPLAFPVIEDHPRAAFVGLEPVPEPAVVVAVAAEGVEHTRAGRALEAGGEQPPLQEPAGTPEKVPPVGESLVHARDRTGQRRTRIERIGRRTASPIRPVTTGFRPTTRNWTAMGAPASRPRPYRSPLR